MADYTVSRDYYMTNRAWKNRGKELLDAVQDVDAELRIANRNTKFLAGALPFSATAVVLPAVFTFFSYNLIVILAMVGAIILLFANAITLIECLSRAGNIKYNDSLPHKLEKARRRYHEWLEADAEPRPPKPEPKLVSTEVMPTKQGKVISRKIQDLETESVDFVDGNDNVITVKNIYKEIFVFHCYTCGKRDSNTSSSHITTLHLDHARMGHKCKVGVEGL